MASTTVSLPLPSSRRGLRWRPDKVLRVLMQDRTLGYRSLPPAILVIVGLVAYPFASAIVMTFQEKTAGAPGRFIGLDNYRELFSSEQFARRCSTPSPIRRWAGPKFLLGLSMALVLNQERFCNNLFHPSLVPGPFRRSCRPQLALDLRRRQRADQQRPGASGADRGDHLLAVQPNWPCSR